jgi:hypothetical protein
MGAVRVSSRARALHVCVRSKRAHGVRVRLCARVLLGACNTARLRAPLCARVRLPYLFLGGHGCVCVPSRNKGIGAHPSAPSMGARTERPACVRRSVRACLRAEGTGATVSVVACMHDLRVSARGLFFLRVCGRGRGRGAVASDARCTASSSPMKMSVSCGTYLRTCAGSAGKKNDHARSRLHNSFLRVARSSGAR